MEVIRMYPPVVGLSKQTPKEGITLCGHYIPGNTLVSVSRLVLFFNIEARKFRKVNITAFCFV